MYILNEIVHLDIMMSRLLTLDAREFVTIGICWEIWVNSAEMHSMWVTLLHCNFLMQNSSFHLNKLGADRMENQL